MHRTQVFTDTNQIFADHPALGNLARMDRAARALESGRRLEALDGTFDGLQQIRENMPPAEWADFARYIREEHDLRSAMHEEPLTRRAFEKPRGYAGDAVMMDYIYGIHYGLDAAAQASPLGREALRYIQGRPACQAVRYRRQHIAQLIDGMAAAGAQPSVLAIAAGHLREAELSQALQAGCTGRVVAFDADADSLREVDAHYGKLGVETVRGSAKHILAGKVSLGTFDFVYAAGLFDYLSAEVAKALTARMFAMTKPGGLTLIPNFMPDVRDRGYMETFMDWHLIYRDEYDMAMLVEGVDAAQIESYDIYTDPTASVVYLAVRKAVR